MRKILFVAILLAIVCLSGCVAALHTEDQITAYLEKQYGEKGRFVLQETVGDGQYIYHDNKRGVDFSVTAVVHDNGENAILPIAHQSIYARLNRGIMYAQREEAVKLAENYELTLKPLDSLIPSGSSDDDLIYVSDYSQLEAAASLFFDLFELYNLEPVESLNGGAQFYYCERPDDMEFQRSAIFLESITYNQLTEGTGHRVFTSQTQLCELLKEKWQSAERWNDEIPRSQP